jgi:hypothetical protein
VGRYRFHVVLPETASTRFITGIRPVKGASDTYEAALASFRESTFSAFGALRVLSVRNGSILVAAAPSVAVPDATLSRWVDAEANALAGYLRRFPEDRAVVFVAPGTSSAMRGVTRGGGGASVLVRLPLNATSIDLESEWVVAHELLHVVFPQVTGDHTWFSEGWASYVEPFARARAGLVSPEKVWADLVAGLPQGLPAPGDRGLDEDHSWGRTYWGGALFFLVADVQIREASHGSRSLEDVAAALAAEGLNVESTLPIERVLDIGDRATSTHVLRDLYASLAHSPGNVDLTNVLTRLGVRAGPAGAEFDAEAPLSGIRRGMTDVRGRSSGGLLSPNGPEK